MTFFHVREILIVGAGVVALTGAAMADDHLLNALDHGLTPDSQPFTTNPAEHSGDLAPGQGSPFGGDELHTPSSLVVTGEEENGTFPDAKPHANIKDRTPK
jgi:hypothetical protein